MDMEHLLQRYFGTTDLQEVGVGAIPAATERMVVDLGLEKDAGQRFALWSLLYMLDAAPDLETVFTEKCEQEAARNFMDMVARAEPD